MKPEIRETQQWLRSAEQHERNGRPVAAMLARHLAWEAQQARDEYAEIQQAAEIQHEAAIAKPGKPELFGWPLQGATCSQLS